MYAYVSALAIGCHWISESENTTVVKCTGEKDFGLKSLITANKTIFTLPAVATCNKTQFFCQLSPALLNVISKPCKPIDKTHKSGEKAARTFCASVVDGFFFRLISATILLFVRQN
jgi:hypothetical protein